METLHETVTVLNKSGVHARPAAMLAQMGRRYKAKITYTAKGETADGKNIIPLTNLGIQCGTQVTINAEGEDAREAIEAIKELINNRFGEHY